MENHSIKILIYFLDHRCPPVVAWVTETRVTVYLLLAIYLLHVAIHVFMLENLTCIRFHPTPPSGHQLFIPEPWLVKTSGQQCLRQMSLMEAIWLIFQLYEAAFLVKLMSLGKVWCMLLITTNCNISKSEWENIFTLMYLQFNSSLKIWKHKSQAKYSFKSIACVCVSCRKQVLATKAEAERDGVKVPTTLAEYCIRTRVPALDEGSDLLYDDYYDDEDLDEDEEEDGEDCCYDEDDSGNEESWQHSHLHSRLHQHHPESGNVKACALHLHSLRWPFLFP